MSHRNATVLPVNKNTLVISGAPAPTGYFGGRCENAGCDDAPFIQRLANTGAAAWMDCAGAHHNGTMVGPDQRSGAPVGSSDHPQWYFFGTLDTVYNAFGGEYFDALIGIANAWMHHPEVFPVAGDVARFFLEFALGGVNDGFAMIDLAGRQLKEYAAQRVAELALKQQVAVGEEGENDDGARMHDVFPDRFLAIGQEHAILADIEQSPLEYSLGRDLGLDQVCIV